MATGTISIENQIVSYYFKNICSGYSLKCLIEMLPMSTHNTCFAKKREIARKISSFLGILV